MEKKEVTRSPRWGSLPPRRVASRRVDDAQSQGAPPSRRTRPILSLVFMPTAEPVGDPTSAGPAPCPDLSFFFAGQDLRRSFSSVARVSEFVRPRESIRRDLDHPRSCCLRDRRSLGLFWFEQTSFWRTSWLRELRSWCWWSRWWSSRPLDCSVSWDCERNLIKYAGTRIQTRVEMSTSETSTSGQWVHVCFAFWSARLRSFWGRLYDNYKNQFFFILVENKKSLNLSCVS